MPKRPQEWPEPKQHNYYVFRVWSEGRKHMATFSYKQGAEHYMEEEWIDGTAWMVVKGEEVHVEVKHKSVTVRIEE